MKMLRVEENVAPNLVPMIDIMFLLLLFFMLSADMTQRELEDVELPKANTALEDPNKNDSRLIVNVHHGHAGCADYLSPALCHDLTHWHASIRNEDFTPDQLMARMRQEPQDRKVMIRSDAKAPYGLPQRITLACAHAGITRVEVGAALTKEKP